MIQLTWGQIRNPEFNPILDRLVRSKMKSFRTAKKLLDIARKIKSEQKKSEEMWAKVVDDYLEPVPDQPQFLRMKDSMSDQEMAEAGNVIEDFNKTEVKIQLPQLTMAEAEDFEVSASDLEILDGLFE